MRAKGTIAILTGGGDVPGLNPAIRAVTIRANHEGYRVLGIRRGWRKEIPDKAELLREHRGWDPGESEESDEEEQGLRLVGIP